MPKTEKFNAAIDKLAYSIESGHLLATMGGAELLAAAADRIKSLEATESRQSALLAALETANARLERENRELKRAMNTGQFSDCPECGLMVKVDEDGCCVSCGRDAMVYCQRAVPVSPPAEAAAECGEKCGTCGNGEYARLNPQQPCPECELPAKTCQWEEDGDESCIYATSCGHSVGFEEPHGYKYCGFCGGKIANGTGRTAEEDR